MKFARIIVLEGKLKKGQLDEIKNYCVNPVDSQIAENEKPETLDMEMTVPEDVATIEGFRDYAPEQLESYRREMGFAMSPEDIKFVQEYYENTEHRDPTLTELKVIDTYWSDHCRHTTFNTTLENISFDDTPYGQIVRKAFAEYMTMRKDVYGERDKNLCLMVWPASEQNISRNTARQTIWTSRKRSTPAASRSRLRSTAEKKTGL